MRNPSIYGALGALLLGIFSLSSVQSGASRLTYHDCEEMLRSGWLKWGKVQTMPGGLFKGRPLSAGTPSPALQILTPEQMTIVDHPIPEGHWFVGNFVSRHGTAMAAIPTVAPRRVSILKENEVDGTLHLILRLVYPKNVKIKFWPQNMEGILGDPFETSDIVIDFGTHRAQGQESKSYNALKGLTGHYALQARMGTTYFKVRRIQREGRGITEYKLDMPKAAKLELVRRFLTRTAEINEGEMYNSLFRNCATEFHFLFRSVGVVNCAESGLLGGLFHNAVTWVPSGLLWTLKKRQVFVADRENEIRIRKEDEL